jgi:hypothetical protein
MTDNWNESISSLLDRFLAAEVQVHAAKEREAEIKRGRMEAEREMKDAKSELTAMLSEAGVTTENHPRATITLVAGRVSLKATDDADPEMLPIDLVKIKKTPDNAAIQAAIARGDKVHGFELAQGSPSLRIKIKETTHAG